jgi:hypothetical protein
MRTVACRVGRAIALIAILGLTLGFTPRARAQESGGYTVTVQVYTCPPGMTADTLVGDDCALVT